tara:strand:- start:616 stop:918 length:303 start_codon:yes stop_codon:yes gene_type:complete
MTKFLSKAEIFDQAKALTTGDRHNAYGDASVNFGRTAEMFNAYLKGRDLSTDPIKDFEIGIFNQLQKISRIAHDPTNQDSHIDNVGFGGISGELALKDWG